MNATAQTSSIGRAAPNFTLPDHLSELHELASLMGAGGVLLGLIGDIWKPVSVHRILSFQRQAGKFAEAGWPVALIIRDKVETLHSFHLSSPLPIPCPLLADADGKTQERYGLERGAGLLLIDRGGLLRYKWLMSGDAIWPEFSEITRAMPSSEKK